MVDPPLDDWPPPPARPARLAPEADTEPATAPDDPMRLAALSPLRALLHLPVLAGIWIGVQMAYGLGLQRAGRSPESMSSTEQMLMLLLAWFAVILAAFVLLQDTGQPRRAVGLASQSWGVDLALGMVGTIAAFAAFYLCIVVMTVVWPAGVADLNANRARLADLVPRASLPAIGGLMVLVAVAEETVFRGILMPHLRRIAGSWLLAAVLSTAAFAALHVYGQEAAVVYPLAGVALVWAGMTIWRRSLIPAIVAHAAFNTIQFWALLATMPAPGRAGS